MCAPTVSIGNTLFLDTQMILLYIRIQKKLALHINFVVAGGQLLHHGFVGGGFAPGGGA